jgi:hypothetical protein
LLAGLAQLDAQAAHLLHGPFPDLTFFFAARLVAVEADPTDDSDYYSRKLI